MLGEANFSDHGANRLGASALMQGLADGYFIAPYTHRQLPGRGEAGARRRPTTPSSSASRADVAERMKRLMAIKGKRTATSFHRELGKLMWDECGMARSEAEPEEGPAEIPQLRERVLARRRACPAATRS